MSAATEIRDARSDYARYVCDHCSHLVGYYGIVREGVTADGRRVLLAACCQECYEERGRL